MSFSEGNTNKQREVVIDTYESKPVHVDIVNDNPVPIVAGYVLIKVGEGPSALYIKQKVKRMKNTGGTNEIKKPGELHKEIIAWLISMEMGRKFTVETIHANINSTRYGKNQDMIGFSSIQGRVSELQFHKILQLIQEGGKNYYLIDRTRANQVLMENHF